MRKKPERKRPTTTIPTSSPPSPDPSLVAGNPERVRDPRGRQKKPEEQLYPHLHTTLKPWVMRLLDRMVVENRKDSPSADRPFRARPDALEEALVLLAQKRKLPIEVDKLEEAAELLRDTFGITISPQAPNYNELVRLNAEQQGITIKG